MSVIDDLVHNNNNNNNIDKNNKIKKDTELKGKVRYNKRFAHRIESNNSTIPTVIEMHLGCILP